MNPLLMARPDKGAGGAFPMDWHEKELELQSQIGGDIYTCTISVIKEEDAGHYEGDSAPNVVTVDMRKVLPRFASAKQRAGHCMYVDWGGSDASKGGDKIKCFNSWGYQDRVLYISRTAPSVELFHVSWDKIVLLGYGGRPDVEVYRKHRYEKN